MNKRIFNYLLIGLVLVVLASCSKDETERSTITNTPMELSTVEGVSEVKEVNQIITISFELNADQIVDTKVALGIDPLKSTATEGVDFNILASEVDVAAYKRKGSFQVEILQDLEAEANETIAFVLSGVHEPFGASNTLSHEVVIKDENLLLIVDWEGTHDAGTFCADVDMDVIFSDATSVDDVGIYVAATGACPEIILMDESWADGTYYLTSNMWDTSLGGLDIDIPLTVTAAKGDIFKETIVIEDNWNSDETTGAGGNGELKPMFSVTKTGTIYKLAKPDGTLIVEGFVAPNSVKEHKAKQPK